MTNSKSRQGELSDKEVRAMRNTHKAEPTHQTITFRAHDEEVEKWEQHIRDAAGNPELSRSSWYADLAHGRCRVAIKKGASIITRKSTRSEAGKRGNRSIRVLLTDKQLIVSSKDNMIMKYPSLTQLVLAIHADEAWIVYQKS